MSIPQADPLLDKLVSDFGGNYVFALDLLEQFLPEFPDQIMLGMDAARPNYWVSYGGAPGLDFLLTTFTAMMRERGLGDDAWERIFLRTPAAAYDRNPTTT